MDDSIITHEAWWETIWKKYNKKYRNKTSFTFFFFLNVIVSDMSKTLEHLIKIVLLSLQPCLFRVLMETYSLLRYNVRFKHFINVVKQDKWTRLFS